MTAMLLPKTLGRLLADNHGLTAVYLPHGISEDFGRALVRSANQTRFATPSYAVLVSAGGEDTSDRECPVLSPQSVIRYRQDAHLAVVVGRHPDLASFNQAFREVLGPDFPRGATASVSVTAIASHSIELILDEAGIKVPQMWDSSEAIGRLEHCFEELSFLHEEMRQGDLPWNAYWLMSVSTGLEHLVKVLRSDSVHHPERSIDDAFSRYTYAAFGLPSPKPSKKIMARPRVILDALEQSWSDEEQLQIVSRQLDHHPATEADAHPVGSIDWEGFDRTRAVYDNTLVALQAHLSSPASIEAFAALSEEQFLDPQGAGKDAVLLVRSASSDDLSFGGVAALGYSLLRTHIAGAKPSLTLQSEIVRVLIPTVGPVKTLEGSCLDLRVESSGTAWKGDLEVDSDGALWAVGTFERIVRKSPFVYRPKPVTVGVRVSSTDPLAGQVITEATCRVFLRTPSGAGMLYWQVKPKGAMGKVAYVGPTSFDSAGVLEEDSSPFTDELADAKKLHSAIIWNSQPAQVYVQGIELQANSKRDCVWQAQLPTGTAVDLTVDESTFRLTASQTKRTFESPVVAAAHNQTINADNVHSVAAASLRGAYETLLGEATLADASEQTLVQETLGHVVLPSTSKSEITGLLPYQGLLMDPDLSGRWPSISDFTVPDSFRESDTVNSFRQAFASLDLGLAMRVHSADGTEFNAWPSQSSWRHLWDVEDDKRKLGQYLEAYSAMVDEARALDDPGAVFWASYPFSISVWNTDPADGVSCNAILLSPFHPIRLAWLAGVESTLWHATDAEQLAGTVEGWNIPLFGPRDNDSGKMVAVPMDSGAGQIFLGWSMLVTASIDSPKPLVAPQQMGSYSSPGNAASGLNATAAEAALRTYRKMNPHVSTLTIDLAAGSPTTRLAEVDDAVLSTVEKWADGQQAVLSGGARIWDSLNRGGEPPSGAVTRFIHASAGTPLTWSRYSPFASGTKECNIRILQDSGVYVRVKSGGKPNRGLIGSVPLRRFEVSVPPVKGANEAKAYPALREYSGWEPLTDALRVLENAASNPILISKLFAALLVDGKADWTISGESMMNPSAMAELIKTSSDNTQMLWEWRPPFLEKGADTALERRPFVSVTRVPQGFRTQVKSLLSKAQGKEVAVSDVDDLLSSLGTRGVGLSSLLSMGGTHAAGALGFYSIFALMESLQLREVDEFILPLDACDIFLKALGKNSGYGSVTRRADLLLLTLGDNEIMLTPIEIKFYGLESESVGSKLLPSPGQFALEEAISQLGSTMSLLEDVKSKWTDVNQNGSEADRSLWTNAMATLVETGIRLSPRASIDPDRLVTRLQQIISAQTDVRLGKPLIAYFLHGGETATGGKFASYRARSPEIGEYGVLTSHAGAALNEVSGTPMGITQEWTALIEWATLVHEHRDNSDSRELGSGVTDSDDRNPSPRAAEQEAADIRLPNDIRRGAERESVLPAARPKEPVQENSFKDVREIAPALEENHTEVPEFVKGIKGEGVRFSVGKRLDSVGSSDVDYWPGNTNLNQMNIGVVGDLGTGKTQLLMTLIAHIRASSGATQETPVSTLIFDYKRDFQDPDFLRRVGGRVLELNQIPLNIFALSKGYSKLAARQKAQAFCDVLTKIYSGVGQVQRERLIQVIVGLFDAYGGRPPTLAEVLEGYREVAPAADSVTSMMSTFVYGEIFSEDPDHLVPFEELLEDTVLVIPLSDLGTDDNAKNALVVLFLNMYYDYMLRAQKYPYLDHAPGVKLRRINSFLLVDEAFNIMRHDFPVLQNILLQGREFGFGTILASQYLSHFRTAQFNYGQPLLTWFIHKVPDVTGNELERLGLVGLAKTTAAMIRELPVHQALYKSFGFPGVFMRGTPFYQLE